VEGATAGALRMRSENRVGGRYAPQRLKPAAHEQSIVRLDRRISRKRTPGPADIWLNVALVTTRCLNRPAVNICAHTPGATAVSPHPVVHSGDLQYAVDARHT